jgi:hypothetical protein
VHGTPDRSDLVTLFLGECDGRPRIDQFCLIKRSPALRADRGSAEYVALAELANGPFQPPISATWGDLGEPTPKPGRGS